MTPNERKEIEKKLRGMTKLQLWERHRNVVVEKMALENKLGVEALANEKLKQAHNDAVTRNRDLSDLASNLRHEKERLEHRILGLQGELSDTQGDLENWKRDYLAMQDAHRKMRQNLFEQARLAGVLAVEGKGRSVGHADLSN